MTVETRDGELRTSDESYQRLFESLSDGAALLEVVFDAGGTPVDYVFLDVNPAYEELVGKPRADRVGHRLSEFLGPQSPAFELLGEGRPQRRGGPRRDVHRGAQEALQGLRLPFQPGDRDRGALRRDRAEAGAGRAAGRRAVSGRRAGGHDQASRHRHPFRAGGRSPRPAGGGGRCGRLHRRRRHGQHPAARPRLRRIEADRAARVRSGGRRSLRQRSA